MSVRVWFGLMMRLGMVLAAALCASPALGADWLYYIGGRDTAGGAPTTDVYYTQVLAGGAISGSWTSAVPIPAPAAEVAAQSVGGDVFIIFGGGCATCGGGCINDVYFATVNPSNGSIAGWTSTAPLPQNGYQPRSAKSAGNWVYVVGLNTGDCWSGQHTPGVGISGWTSQPAPPAPGGEHNLAGDGANLFVYSGWSLGTACYGTSISGGAMGGWSITAPLAANLFASTMATAGGYLYIFGGGGSGSSDIYSAQITGPALAGWNSVGQLPNAMFEHDVVFHQPTGYFFEVAGCGPGCACSGGFQNDCWSAQMIAGGNVSGWSTQTALPIARAEGAAVIVDSVLTTTPTPTNTPSRTRTPTRTRTPVNVGNTPIPTPTCPSAYASATPPFLLVDKNVFNPDVEYLQIIWAVKDAGQVQVSIFNSAGEFIRRLELGTCGLGGELYHTVWDGKNFQDKVVSGNVYILRLVTLGAKDAIVRRVAVQR